MAPCRSEGAGVAGGSRPSALAERAQKGVDNPGRDLLVERTAAQQLLLPGIFDGEHSLRIEPADGHVRFVQSERFNGLLVPLFGKTLEQTWQGFVQMNEALKRRAEAQ